MLIMDEADEMLRQGFQEDIEKIFQYVDKHCGKKTQNLLFSATIPTWVN
jgi:superfamily II DNA/RNA helicase